jgi:hypothetical protein
MMDSGGEGGDGGVQCIVEDQVDRDRGFHVHQAEKVKTHENFLDKLIARPSSLLQGDETAHTSLLGQRPSVQD